METDQALELGIQIAGALDAAHAKGRQRARFMFQVVVPWAYCSVPSVWGNCEVAQSKVCPRFPLPHLS